MLLELFLTFAKIGLFTFGGGYAMLSVIEYNCVEEKKWITHEDMMDVTVIAESTPGPIAINCASFVGYRQAGLPGAIAATVGVVLPSFVIIYIISMFLDNFLEITLIANAFLGIKLAVGILIVDAAVTMIRKRRWDAMSKAIFLVALGLMLLSNVLATKISSIVLMVAAGLLGIGLMLLRERSQKGGAEK